MLLSEYQQQAMRTANTNDPATTTEQRLCNAALGLSGEAAELLHQLTDVTNEDLTQESVNDLIKELGDILWYAAFAADTLGFKLDEYILDNPIAVSNLPWEATSIAIEAGAIADAVKKHVFHGHKLDKTVMIWLLGNIIRSVDYICSEVSTNIPDQITIRTVMEKNIEKLWKRYPKGFSQEDSINRKDS